MITPDINALFPRFIREDRNGYAMAAAITKGMTIFCEKVQDGIEYITDIDKMPEWRLDEMAEEMGCVYDPEGTLAQKRDWIRYAVKNSLHLGTAAIIEEYLSTKLDGVRVEEWPQYGGSAYHFRVKASGVTPRKAAWAMDAINRLKNVRSVCDGVSEELTGTFEVTISGATGTAETANTIGQIVLDTSGTLS